MENHKNGFTEQPLNKQNMLCLQRWFIKFVRPFKSEEAFMKPLLLVLAISTFSITLEARPNKWTCWARGKQGFGGPIGELWVHVRGNGRTQFEAANRAQQSCFSQGLQMCIITDCHKL